MIIQCEAENQKTHLRQGAFRSRRALLWIALPVPFLALLSLRASMALGSKIIIAIIILFSTLPLATSAAASSAS